jgi:flavin reductase (DIM6/NTAB) family NADH-FMN oxidoreductase RutF
LRSRPKRRIGGRNAKHMLHPQEFTARQEHTMQELPAWKAYRLLEAGPIVLVATVQDGKPNLMTMGFHMVIRHDPPLLGCVVGPWDHSFSALRESGECVIAIPTIDLAEKIVDIGNCSGAEVDKFEKFGLTALPSSEISAPLVAECFANIECRVAEFLPRYDLFILEPLRIWIDEARKERRTLHHNGDGTFTVDGEKIDLKDRMVLWKQFQD